MEALYSWYLSETQDVSENGRLLTSFVAKKYGHLDSVEQQSVLASLRVISLNDERGFFLSLGLELVDVNSEDDSVGQLVPGVVTRAFASSLSALTTVKRVVLRTGETCSTATVDFVWKMARKAFEFSLGSHYSLLTKAASWVGDIWSTMQTWANSMVSEYARWMAGFQECLSLGMGAIGISAVLVLLEKFMIASGIIGGPLNLASTFVLVFFGYLGLTEGKTLLAKGLDGVHQVVDACKRVIAALTTMLGAAGTQGAAGQDVASLLETFASGFGKIDLVGVGRTFNAFNQISNGSKVVWACVQQICHGFWLVLDKAFGIQSRALADLSVMLGYDLQGWLQRCDGACEYLTKFNSVPQDILRTFRILRTNGQNIRDALLKRDMRGSAAALVTVNKALEKLQLLLDNAILAGTGGPRKEPFWLYIYGQAGVGKSTLANKAVGDYLASKDLDKFDTYPRNTADPFWSGYRRQTAVTFDDLGALSSPTVCEEGELLKLVSRDAMALNMASLVEKGMYFDSSLIVTSSNFISANPKANIHDLQAYDRRRSILVEVVKKDGVEMEPGKMLNHQRYVVRSRYAPYEVVQTFEDYNDFYAYFLNALTAHEEKEAVMMSNLAIPEKTISTAYNVLVANFLVTPPISMQEFAKSGDLTYLAVVDDKVYFLDDATETHSFPISQFDSLDVERARGETLLTAMKFSQGLRFNPCMHSVAAHFLVELIQKDVYCADLSVNKEHVEGDLSLEEVAVTLPLWQRVLVRAMSNSFSCGGRGWFGDLYDTFVAGFTATHLREIVKWPTLIKLGVGILSVLIFGKLVLRAFTSLGNFGYGAAFSMAAARTFCLGQDGGSEHADKRHDPDRNFSHRNVPVRTRHWSRGQNFGVGYAWLMKNCLAYLRTGHLEGQVVMLPGRKLVGVIHFLRRIPDGALVEVSLDEQKYTICWHTANFTPLEGSELGVYEHPTVRQVSATVADRVMFGLEQIPETFQATFCSCKRDEISGDFVPEVASVMVKKRTRALNVWAGEYQRLIPVSLEYEAPTVNKDCGSLLVANVKGVDKLVGIHVAGLNGKGQACFLPETLAISCGQNFCEDFEAFAYPEQVGNGASVVGILKAEKQFHIAHKSAYKQTPQEWHLKTECTKVPAVLHKHDPRLEESGQIGFDPYRAGMEKYQQEAGPFEENLLSEVCDEVVETWFDAGSSFDLSESTDEEAINGVAGLDYFDPVVMGTSEGYPHILTRDGKTKGKDRFFNLENGQLVPGPYLRNCMNRLEEECSERVPELVGVEHAKDEKLPRRKVFDKAKTRLFTVVPMEFNIIIRKKFLKFVRFMIKSRDVLPCQVGINPLSREWNRLAIGLLEKSSNILCCDYSRFDGILSKQVMWHIGLMINKFCGGSERLQRQRLHLLQACCSRYAICAGKVWRVENGIPSGVALTVILNSIFNEVIIRYIYRKVAPERLIAKSFRNYVRLVVFGDDNLIAIHSTAIGFFNGESIQREAASLGITITDGCDKTLTQLNFRPLEECDFLKRGFKRDQSGIWRAPIELDSLWSQLHWVKTGHMDMADAYLVNVESVLRELWLHDVGMCGLFRRRVLALSWVPRERVPTLEQIEEFHDMQMNGMAVFSSHDALVTPEQLGPINHSPKSEPFVYGKFIATTAAQYVPCDGDFVVVLGKHVCKYAHGFNIWWDAGSGRGELPTTLWLRSHVLRRNAEMVKRLKAAIDQYQRIVFLGRSTMVYPTIFLVLFGRVLGFVELTTSNLVLARAIEVTRSLGYLVDDLPEFFFEAKERERDSTLFGRLDFCFFGSKRFAGFLREAIPGVTVRVAGADPPIVVGNLRESLEFRAQFCRQVSTVGLFATILLNDEVVTREFEGNLEGTYQSGHLRCVLTFYEDAQLSNYECEIPYEASGKRLLEGYTQGLQIQGMSLEERLVFHPVHKAAHCLAAARRTGV